MAENMEHCRHIVFFYFQKEILRRPSEKYCSHLSELKRVVVQKRPELANRKDSASTTMLDHIFGHPTQTFTTWLKFFDPPTELFRPCVLRLPFI